MKRIIVTGGAGVIGTEIVPKLLSRGYSVWVGDIKPKPETCDDRVIYRQGDLNSLTLAEVEAFNPDIIIHLAATFERSVETPGFWGENFLHNVSLSHHIMSIAQQLTSLTRVVFASSYLIYHPDLYQFETAPDHPVSLKESDPVLPRNLTGMAKLSHEIELRFLADQIHTSFSIVCTRIFRGYGRNSRDVISRWVRALLQGESIEVYNSEGMFDYLYARDSAEGLIRIAEEKTVTGIINLGTGKSRRVADVVSVLRGYFPEMSVVEHDSVPPLECSQADMALWKSTFDWLPSITLEEAIPEIIDYERTKLLSVDKITDPAQNVLLTSASAKVPLIRAVKVALGKYGSGGRVWAGDIDSAALASYVADGFWHMPGLTELVMDDFVAGCQERKIGMIIPTRDGELEFWSRHKDALQSEGIAVVVSPLLSVVRCLDKMAFSKFGQEQGLPFIPAAESIDELGLANVAKPRYIVKERYGAGSRSIGLDLSREAAQAHALTLIDPMFQPFVVGREMSVDAWLDSTGMPKGLVMRWRDKVVNGESQVTTTFRQVDFERCFTQILSALDLRGPVVIQALVDDKNQLHVIECNSRFGGASTASIAAGLDSFYWSILEAKGRHLKSVPFMRSQGELRQIRTAGDELVHDSGI